MNGVESWTRSRRAAPRLCVIDCVSRRYSLWTPVVNERAIAATEPAILTAHVASIIGPNGVARIREFWNYPSGWDAGRGSPLSPISVSLLEDFAAIYSEFQRTPSVFLTREGYLVLAWEDLKDARIEVEFAPSGVEVYFAATDEEFTFSTDEVGMRALVERIRRHATYAA